MKQFFKMMFASALGVFISIGILILIWLVMLIGMVSSLSSSPQKMAKSDEKVLVLPLKGFLPEVANESPIPSMLNQKKSLSIKDVLEAIEIAKESKQIEGIYLDISALFTGTASVDVIRRSLIDFKESGKFVVAYGDNYTQNGYYLASVADKIFLNPQGALALTGLSSQVSFYKGILKKAGIEMVVFKVGTFKGAVEPFLLDKLSDENRQQITSYQQSIWKNIVCTIAFARNISNDQINGFVDNGFMFAPAQKAVEYGFVDELNYKEEATKYVKGLVGDELNKNLKAVSVASIKGLKKKNPVVRGDQIAVIYAEGEITSSDFVSPYGNSNVITEKFAEDLIKLKRDDKVKAVVLRINSPGGSGFVSEQIWKQVNDLKNEKTIVVSMGNVAASGGYYIACAADKIVAEPNTLTGSIGVFSAIPNAAELYAKLDLTTDVVKTNKYGDIGDPSRPMHEDEKALIQGSVEHFYDVFITRCADGRGMSKNEIDEIAQGRVWTGEQALERGLVDELGGLVHAIKVAAELANLEDYQIKTVTRSNDPLMEFVKKFAGEVKTSIMKDALGDEYEMFDVIRSIKRMSGIQARLPYDIGFL